MLLWRIVWVSSRSRRSWRIWVLNMSIRKNTISSALSWKRRKRAVINYSSVSPPLWTRSWNRWDFSMRCVPVWNRSIPFGIRWKARVSLSRIFMIFMRSALFLTRFPVWTRKTNVGISTRLLRIFTGFVPTVSVIGWAVRKRTVIKRFIWPLWDRMDNG